MKKARKGGLMRGKMDEQSGRIVATVVALVVINACWDPVKARLKRLLAGGSEWRGLPYELGKRIGRLWALSHRVSKRVLNWSRISGGAS